MRMVGDIMVIEMESTGYVSDFQIKAVAYHSKGPNDESANDQQDLAHHMYLMTLEGKLHLAPICNPHYILDVGTGTGTNSYPPPRIQNTTTNNDASP